MYDSKNRLFAWAVVLVVLGPPLAWLVFVASGLFYSVMQFD